MSATSPIRQMMRSMLRGALLLMIAAAAGGGLVVTVYDATAERILANERAALLANLNTLIPADQRDNDPLLDTIEVTSPNLLGSKDPLTAYRARRDGQPIAVILTVIAPNGYSGAIRLLVAVRSNGSLAGVRVIQHKETPGLGDKLELQKSDWILSFTGKSLDNPRRSGWAVRKDNGEFDQFTGATITPRAVVRAVYNALKFFQQEREKLLAALPDEDADNARNDVGTGSPGSTGSPGATHQTTPATPATPAAAPPAGPKHG